MVAVVLGQLLHRGRSGNVTGPLHFSIGGSAFPEEGWDDFPVITLGWWLDGVARLAQGESRSEAFDFMDGPYSVTCELRSDGAAEICGWADREARRRLTSEMAPLDTLIEGLSQAGVTALAFCECNGWEDADIELLRARLGALKVG